MRNLCLHELRKRATFHDGSDTCTCSSRSSPESIPRRINVRFARYGTIGKATGKNQIGEFAEEEFRKGK
ncbi:hypothetical protein RRG08_034178 [Elysia crispata]|uniref:Uncharacterized protein n=1 Tax=Elysia crispata TaxID=231223 RepID=A0AAE1ED86_9GAST|nr:hypothetical protein RRG08_034178 [Elysia crispata]